GGWVSPWLSPAAGVNGGSVPATSLEYGAGGSAVQDGGSGALRGGRGPGGCWGAGCAGENPRGSHLTRGNRSAHQPASLGGRDGRPGPSRPAGGEAVGRLYRAPTGVHGECGGTAPVRAGAAAGVYGAYGVCILGDPAPDLQWQGGPPAATASGWS